MLIVATTVACSSGKKQASPASTTPTTATTSTTGSSSAVPPGSLRSNDPAAIALNSSLLTPAEVQRALSIGATPTTEPAGSSTPQGPLNETGLLNAIPGAATYRPMFERDGGGVGANATYHLGHMDIDLAAIKFATAAGAQSFVEQVVNLAKVLAKAQVTPHEEFAAGVLPSNDRVVVRVPPSPIADASNETVATSIVYSNGAFYLVTLLGPPGTITDQQIVALATAQDRKWAAARPSLGIG
jgi:hypothetical protein